MNDHLIVEESHIPPNSGWPVASDTTGAETNQGEGLDLLPREE
jgi:hypothetical protein